MIITLTTDFGISSPYVAQMKGVILGIAPDATIVDLTHAIGPQDVAAGAIALRDATPHFPPATIHVAVVDPGVGSARQIVFAEARGQRYLGPDNGVLSLALRGAAQMRLHAVTNAALWRAPVSATFHGRDILAPVAARLSLGLDPRELGPALERIIELNWPRAQRHAGQLTGQITHVDAFGNLTSNITRTDLAGLGAAAVQIGHHTIDAIGTTYSERAPGELVALFGSSECLEVAVVNGSAADRLQAGPGEPIVVRLRP